ncbi:S-layer family protein [Paenibacillus cellulosilyticus]|uniref:S-layer family protein n=1 Tax=Paenibacillus cellulosilyticus TaxID=375489 RepID=A0A2V2Z014_9BACL|nr:S-layer homology domain-containing protein [Paenibacillus cellulosilyticus]PWW07387.1 S-layer family protein [Paenibacillus cellulosilyticus]
MTLAKFKKVAISSMAAMVLLSGASTAFAKGHDNDDKKDDKDDKKNSSSITINVNFKDEEDLKWATEYIIRLASKGIVNGYEDGTFKPNKKISRIETIVAAVRLMGLREQAESAEEMSTDLNFKDADQLKKKYPWAVGYVAVALENDLFSETEDSIQPEKPATRLWSATILVKALKLEAEAKAKSSTKLTFKDAKQIPAGSVGYVAVALEKGIITGYSDNTFRPNQQVTRAELAALLDRTDSQLPDSEDTDIQAITGTLKASVSNNSLTVVKSDNTEKTLTIDPNVFIFRDNKKASLSDLKAGDEVLVRTYNGNVIFIEVTKLAETTTTTTDVTGTLKAAVSNNSIVVVKADKTEAALTVDKNTVVVRNNKTAKLSDLKAGDEVLVRTSNGKVIYIQVTKLASTTTTADVTGTLKAAVSNNSIVVVKADKTETTLAIDSNAVVLRDNKTAKLSDLKAGDEVFVRTYNGKVILIQVTKLAETATTTTDVTGTLKAAVSNNSIVVVKADKTETTLTIDSNAVVLRDNKTAALTDLKAGDEVFVRTYNGKVILIQVTKLAEASTVTTDVTGTLKAAVSNNSIVVIKSDNTESTLTLDSSVVVLRDNKTAALTDLKAGDEVFVRTYNGKVIFIQVTKLAPAATAALESGSINSVTVNAQGKLATISIMKSVNGTLQAYIFNVASDVVISGDSSKLIAGQAVDLTIINDEVKIIIIK